MVSLDKIIATGVLSLGLYGCEPKIDVPGGPSPEAVVTPAQPKTWDDLHCRVKNSEGLPFDFIWYVDGIGYWGEQGYETTLDGRYTRSGDIIECVAYAPLSYIEVSSDMVYIE